MQLGDCVCQMLYIGPLHFCAFVYGDAINLPEKLQQKLVAVDMEERNQCTLLAVDAGIIASDSKPGNLPSRSRAAKLADALRLQEWAIASPIGGSDGVAKSISEKTMMSLRHDITQPNHDMDYRTLAIFIGPFAHANNLTLRISDVLDSGSGDKALRLKVIGSLRTGKSYGFLDILAPNGHMRWLQPGNDTLP